MLSWPVAGFLHTGRPEITSIGTEHHHAEAPRRGRTEGLGRRRRHNGKRRLALAFPVRGRSGSPSRMASVRGRKSPGYWDVEGLQAGSSRPRALSALHAASQHQPDSPFVMDGVRRYL